MSMLVKLLGAFSPGHVLTHEGKDFTFRAIDKTVKAALTVAYFKRAREGVYAIKGEVDEADYDRQLKGVLDAWRKGEYDFRPGLESFLYFMGVGLTELVCHLTGRKEQEVTALLEARTVEVLHLCYCLAWDCLGGEDKKKLLKMEGTPWAAHLIELFTSYSSSPTTSTNGSPCSTPTKQPASPERASEPTSSPA